MAVHDSAEIALIARSVQDKWDRRYRSAQGSVALAAEVLRDHAHHLCGEGDALDLACGLGGNALFLAQHGYRAHAWDISPVAIDLLEKQATTQGLDVQCQVRDLVSVPPEPDSFDVIVVSRYLERSLCPAIATALRSGGLLFYQTFTSADRKGCGPSNPQFMLAQGELPKLFHDLEVLVYQEGEEAMLVASRH